MMEDARIIDFDNGDIEYFDGKCKVVVENCFRFVANTPRVGNLYVRTQRDGEWIAVNQEHDFEEFDDYVGHFVASYVERW